VQERLADSSPPGAGPGRARFDHDQRCAHASEVVCSAASAVSAEARENIGTNAIIC